MILLHGATIDSLPQFYHDENKQKVDKLAVRRQELAIEKWPYFFTKCQIIFGNRLMKAEGSHDLSMDIKDKVLAISAELEGLKPANSVLIRKAAQTLVAAEAGKNI